MSPNPYAIVCKKKGTPLFIPFVVLGDPDRKKSIDIVRLLIESGADALELGFPFSDPPADGPIIQAAGVRALRAGIRIDDCFAMLREIREFTDIPIGLLVYYNLVLRKGVEKFYQECAASRIDSVLIADMPIEHAQEIIPAAKRHGIAPIFLVSDVTTDERLNDIAKIADGYVYIASYLGVTGNANVVFEKKLRDLIVKVRKSSQLPLFVGFGISTTEHVRAVVAAGADGVIVGSRIVQDIDNPQKIQRICRELADIIKACA